MFCPYEVFTLRKLTAAERKAMPFGPWLKVIAHGGKQAFVTNPDALPFLRPVRCGLSRESHPLDARYPNRG